MKTILDALNLANNMVKGYFTASLPLIFTISPIFALFAAIVTFSNLLVPINEYLTTLTSSTFAPSWGGLYAKMDVGLPLTETIALSGLLISYKIICNAARMIKGIVPTWN